jgi:uncharacterized protein
MHSAKRVIASLRAQESEPRKSGLRSLSLFGSLARGEAETSSDIDLAAEFDPSTRMDLLRLAALKRRLAELLGSPGDVLPDPVDKRRSLEQINRDRVVPSRYEPAACLVDIVENIERIDEYLTVRDRLPSLKAAAEQALRNPKVTDGKDPRA